MPKSVIYAVLSVSSAFIGVVHMIGSSQGTLAWRVALGVGFIASAISYGFMAATE